MGGEGGEEGEGEGFSSSSFFFFSFFVLGGPFRSGSRENGPGDGTS